MSNSSKAKLQSSVLQTSKTIEPRFASEIGYVCVHWSLLETVVFTFLNDLSGGNEAISAVLFAEASFLQKMNMVSAMIHLSRREDWAAEWQGIGTTVDTLRNQRNDVVHGLWGATSDNRHYLMRLRSRSKVSVSTLEKDVAEIKKLANEIVFCLASIDEFRLRLLSQEVAKKIKFPTGPALNHVQSRQSQAQAQARAEKQARAQESRELALKKSNPPKDKS